MANPTEKISPNDAQKICTLVSQRIYPGQYPGIYQSFFDKYSNQAVYAKISECESRYAYKKKKKDISSQELLANYRIQQLQKNKMDQFKGESN